MSPSPTATVFPTSEPQPLSVPGNVEGTQFVAQDSGVHRFTITSGAYSPCPPHVAYPDCGKWHAYLVLYVNRDIAWSSEPDRDGFVGPVNEDLSIGDPTFRDTAGEAEAASSPSLVDIPLHQGDFLWLLPQDAKGTYVDNAGLMTLDVTVISPLP